VSWALVVLTHQDADACEALHVTGFAKPWSANEFEDLLQQVGVIGLGVVDAAGILVGISAVQIAAGTADLLTIVVGPDARGQGAARYLLKGMISRLGERGIEQVILEVAEDNDAAQKLYAWAGFQCDGRRKKYYTSGRETPVDAILMSLKLSL
jgi:ribosomal-protein-alanine N-acetyltransferase